MKKKEQDPVPDPDRNPDSYQNVMDPEHCDPIVPPPPLPLRPLPFIPHTVSIFERLSLHCICSVSDSYLGF